MIGRMQLWHALDQEDQMDSHARGGERELITWLHGKLKWLSLERVCYMSVS